MQTGIAVRLFQDTYRVLLWSIDRFYARIQILSCYRYAYAVVLRFNGLKTVVIVKGLKSFFQRTYLGLTLACVAISAFAQDDPLLNILDDELNREMVTLKKAETPPYYIDYRVNEL